MHFRLRCVTNDFLLGEHSFDFHLPEKNIGISVFKRPADDGGPPVELNDGVAVAICERQLVERLHSAAVDSGKLSSKKKSVKDVWDELHDLLMRTLRLIRWRTNFQVTAWNPYKYLEFCWSVDGAEWKRVDDCLTLKIAFERNIVIWNQEAEEFVRASLSASLDEPHAHELLREAEVNRRYNRRSSLALAVAAAEAGFKEFASSKLPDTAWLLKLPTPPLEKMIESFPWHRFQFQPGPKTISFPDPLLKAIKKAVALRNKLLHVGTSELSDENILEVLQTVREMLYFLDMLNGQMWAYKFVGPEIWKLFTD